MKALSIQQPWAWAIINVIHAGKKVDKSAYGFIEKLLKRKIPDNLPTGGIVGRSEIYNCVKQFGSEWVFGEYGFLLRNSIELPFQPLRGQLGFFETGIEI